MLKMGLELPWKTLESPWFFFLPSSFSLFLLLFLQSLIILSSLSFFLIWSNQSRGNGCGFDLLFYLLLLQIFNLCPCLLIATHAFHYTCHTSMFSCLAIIKHFSFPFSSYLDRPTLFDYGQNLTFQFPSKLLNQS